MRGEQSVCFHQCLTKPYFFGRAKLFMNWKGLQVAPLGVASHLQESVCAEWDHKQALGNTHSDICRDAQLHVKSISTGDFNIPLSQLMSADASCANCKAAWHVLAEMMDAWLDGWIDLEGGGWMGVEQIYFTKSLCCTFHYVGAHNLGVINIWFAKAAAINANSEWVCLLRMSWRAKNCKGGFSEAGFYVAFL